MSGAALQILVVDGNGRTVRNLQGCWTDKQSMYDALGELGYDVLVHWLNKSTAIAVLFSEISEDELLGLAL